MHLCAMEFPRCARHPDGSVWYRFHSARHFEELKRFGQGADGQPRYLHSELEEVDFSTGIYIQDLLLALEKGELLPVEDKDFEALKLRA